MQVTFRVFKPHSDFPNPTTPIQEYSLEVESPEQLEQQYQEARQVWADHQVEAVLEGGFTRGENLTYQEQLLQELQPADQDL